MRKGMWLWAIATLPLMSCDASSGSVSPALQACLDLARPAVRENGVPVPGYYFNECIQERLTQLGPSATRRELEFGGFDCRDLDAGRQGYACYRSAEGELPVMRDRWSVVVEIEQGDSQVRAARHAVGY